MRSQRLILVLLIILALPSLASAANPRTFTLKKADLGSQFVLKASGIISNANLVSNNSAVSASNLQEWGRISGYKATYRYKLDMSGIAKSPHGLLQVETQVDTYRSSAGARAFWHASFLSTLKNTPQNTKIIRVQLGKEAYLLTYSTLASDGQVYKSYLFTWYSKKVVATLNTIGLSQKLSRSAALHLAAKQQAYIKS